MMTKFSILVLVLFFSHFSNAQLLNGAPEPVFPSLPFDLKGAVNNNYKLVSVVYETYIKTEGDESGFPWKNQVMNYQQARYTIRDNKLEAASFYDTLNRKIYAYECSYIDGLLSAVEYFSFDSMLVAKSNYVFNYAYRDTFPFQKVLMLNEDKKFRLLYDYEHDKDARLIRLNVTAHGEPLKEASIKLAEDELTLLLVAYSGDSKTKRYYKNMHDLHLSEKTLYNEKGLPINTKIRDGDNKLLTDIIYIYEGEVLVKEKHTKYENKVTIGEKQIFYVYESNGLMSKIIEEDGDTQQIVNLLYQEEY